VTSCRWLYPKKDVKEPVTNVDKGKKKVLVEKNVWVPTQTNPTGIGSSNAFAALEVTNTTGTKSVKYIADNSFSFALHNVVDRVPQRTTPHETEPILTLVTNEAQDDALSVEGDGGQSGSATRPTVVSELPLISVEQNMEQAQLNDDDVIAATLSEHGADLNADVSVGGEVLVTDIPECSDDDIVVIHGDNTSAYIVVKAHTNPLFERAEGMTHTNPRIQRDLDLWQKVREYDKRVAENPPFVPVLSKKQQQILRKHQFDGKAPYRTRSTGDISPPVQ